MSNEPLATTTSLCPDCLERVPGQYEARDDGVHLTRTCPDHSDTSRKVWGSVDHWEWAGDLGPEFSSEVGVEEEFEYTVDNDHACLAVVEVTEDCNLSCSYCFASSGPGGDHRPFETVLDLLDTVAAEGGPRPIQFSGGEPTVRDDLPELVEAAVEKGFEHIEINTNGIRLAEEDGYAQRLADAGVTAVYLQFDGLTGETYEEIREVDIADEKHEAIDACREAGLSVVLVPTVVPGVNDDEMGDIVRFGLANMDVVESVNFQPVAHFGRYADHDGRFALDDAARLLAEQVEPLGARDMMPIPCCSSYCQMATALMPDDDGAAVPLTAFIDDDAYDAVSGLVDESDWMELLASTADGRESACSVAGCCGIDVPEGAEGLLGGILPITITGFMDADAADASRLDNCCISVPTESGDLVPFCAYNMTTDDGEYAIRNRNGWGGRDGVGQSLPNPPESEVDALDIEADGGVEADGGLDADDPLGDTDIDAPLAEDSDADADSEADPLVDADVPSSPLDEGCCDGGC